MNKQSTTHKLVRLFQYTLLVVIVCGLLSFALGPMYIALPELHNMYTADEEEYPIEYTVEYDETHITQDSSSISGDVHRTTDELSTHEEEILDDARLDGHVELNQTQTVPELFTDEKTIVVDSEERMHVYEVDKDEPTSEIGFVLFIFTLITIVTSLISLLMFSLVVGIYQHFGMLESIEMFK